VIGTIKVAYLFKKSLDENLKKRMREMVYKTTLVISFVFEKNSFKLFALGNK
jgi:hypothetical protein